MFFLYYSKAINYMQQRSKIVIILIAKVYLIIMVKEPLALCIRGIKQETQNGPHAIQKISNIRIRILAIELQIYPLILMLVFKNAWNIPQMMSGVRIVTKYQVR